MSQLKLALKAGVSSRHVSFVETGRSRPSREMIVQLAASLDVPLRDRNQLLLAAGYAPLYGQRGLDEPEMEGAREVLEQLLRGHEPYPAFVADRHWGMVAGNRAVAVLIEGAAPELLEPPVNILRLCLHPNGVAPRIVNFAELRCSLLAWLARQAASTGDPALAALHEELRGLPGEPSSCDDRAVPEIAVPPRIRWGDHELSLISTITTFARATDITLAELSIESFFPTDRATAEALRTFAAAQS
jgi:transcriptional regulator with XRE-family HTH domain